MSSLIHIIYCSAATVDFTSRELSVLLREAREKNSKNGVTGLLLYAEGSFFQVIEGEMSVIDPLFEVIRKDKRHVQVTQIIREPIKQRMFGDWTMGYADLSLNEIGTLVGINDFFRGGKSFTALGEGRAKRLLAAFNDGRWRTRLSGRDEAVSLVEVSDSGAVALPKEGALPGGGGYTFAFQPIVDAADGTIFSYEALIRGEKNETADMVLGRVPDDMLHRFDEQSRIRAIEIASHLGLATHLNLNFLPASIQTSQTAVSSILQTAKRHGVKNEQIVLEVLEKEIIEDIERFSDVLSQYRREGILLAIDDFGSGYAGLTLLAEFQPDLIKLDIELVKGIERKGARQAIVRGIIRTCEDLGIDIIAEGVERVEEYQWLRSEGIRLFQGNLLSPASLETLAIQFKLPRIRI